jgi:hypothetical protein
MGGRDGGGRGASPEEASLQNQVRPVTAHSGEQPLDEVGSSAPAEGLVRCRRLLRVTNQLIAIRDKSAYMLQEELQ